VEKEKVDYKREMNKLNQHISDLKGQQSERDEKLGEVEKILRNLYSEFNALAEENMKLKEQLTINVVRDEASEFC